MEPRTPARRNPLLGAAVLKATLALDGDARDGTAQDGPAHAAPAQRGVFEDLLLALGITEEQVDAYSRDNPELVAGAIARARGQANRQG